MALTYELGQIPVWTDLLRPDGEGGTCLRFETEALIWASITVALPGVTRDNLPEWERRLECLRGTNIPPFATYRGKEWWPSREDLVRHIGLTTNASRMGPQAWNRRKLAAVVERYGMR